MKVLILGYGSIGKRHFNILRKIKKIKQIKICTNSKISKNLKIFYDEISLLSYDPEYIIISSPTHKHFDQLKFINKIFKNKIILVEKPIFHSKNLNFSNDLNNKVFVGYNLRFDPAVIYLKKFINAERINNLLSVTVYCGSFLPNWRKNTNYTRSYSVDKHKGGGVEYDLSHEFDYINWIFGNFKLIKKINNKISNLQIKSNDHLIYIGKFKKNSYLNISLNYFSKIKMRFLIIEIKDMTMKVDLINRKIISKKNNSKNISSVKFSNNSNSSYEAMHKAIIAKKYDNLCSFKNALKVLSFT
tara:strand:+ start:127 stop:1029 length:903 start_codon:yes stop_codon:yes gene_type:complete